jgi:hypothetical protein
MSHLSCFHLRSATGGHLPLAWLPCEKHCRAHLRGARWTQALLDAIPMRHLGYYLQMRPSDAMYANLQMKVESGSLPADLWPLALGMLRTLEDLLGLSKSPCLDWAHVILSQDHNHFIEMRLDVFELVRLTRVSKQAHALYKDKLTALLELSVSKNPATRVLEAYLPERHRFPRPLGNYPHRVFTRFNGLELLQLEDVPYVSIKLYDEKGFFDYLEITVGMSYANAKPCLLVVLRDMTQITQCVRIFKWKDRNSVPACEDEEKSPHPAIQWTERDTYVTVTLSGRVWRGLGTDMIDVIPSCHVYFKLTEADALITFVRDVIRTVCPTIAPSIPLAPPNMKDGEAGDGGPA